MKKLFVAILLTGVAAHAYAQNPTMRSPINGNTIIQSFCVNDDGYLKSTRMGSQDRPAAGDTQQHLRRCTNHAEQAEQFVCRDDDGYLWLQDHGVADDRSHRTNGQYRISRCGDAAAVLPGGATVAGEAAQGSLTPVYVGAAVVGAAVIAAGINGGGNGDHTPASGGGNASGGGGTGGTTGTR